LLKSIREALVSSKQWLRAVAAALLLGISLTAGAAPARADDVLDRGFGSSPDTLDPQLNFGARELWIQDDMYEGLVVIDNSGKIVPGSAESWDVSTTARPDLPSRGGLNGRTAIRSCPGFRQRGHPDPDAATARRRPTTSTRHSSSRAPRLQCR
jgi:hypothetical protein